ncbi:hypothetical protein RFI_36854 [Reticulomyxa filosa]|uniref:AAA+ ATPase domain-containing protein n=1 Tax=Reticulomyxa filosa TaxID=46433 RepID=X6LIQ0_RETFI|nr:hypothetical protein RFI_36854 [Reticulomyxa filosa]|eukprot:ETO00585.1 hypothetical protein RFI_36854 [Reticulomyxa filosa]
MYAYNLCVNGFTVVLVGDPGTSKTLSLQILRDNMCQSEIENFQTRLNKKSIDLKALHVVSFQCTQNSKALRIEERWNQAISHSESKLVKPLLLLDEIGLAEHSKHSPLKVLHHLLENPKISFVGLSNWPLDAAKMNRVIVHQIPNNLDDDLKAIGEAIYKTEEHTNLPKGDIDMLVDVFKELNKQISKQKLPLCKENWLGRRDFYALIRHYMHNQVPRDSFQGVMRNLGGFRDPQFQKCLADALKKGTRKSVTEILTLMSAWEPLQCVKMNLQDENCRHCMLVCEKPYSWQLLLDHNLLSCEDAVFLFESNFAADRATMTGHDHLHKVINCMEIGKKAVLYKLKSIHECLYDMLNQRYYGNSLGVFLFFFFLSVIPPFSFFLLSENRFCRVAMEDQTRDCTVAKEFKCIVIVFKEDMENSVITYIEQFNRFVLNLFVCLILSLVCCCFLQRPKKHFLDALKSNTFHTLGRCLNPTYKQYQCLKKSLRECHNLCTETELSELFYGFNDDTIPSAISHILLQPKSQLQSDCDDDEDIKQNEKKKLEKLSELFYPLRHPAKIACLAMEIPPRNTNSTSQPFNTFVEYLLSMKKVIIVILLNYSQNKTK